MSDIVKELRELLDKATPGPWVYRPHKNDDWGVVRATDGNGYPIAQARAGRHVTDDEYAAHRVAKTDPFEANARLIAAARNHLPAILARIEALEAALQRQPEPATSAAGIKRRHIRR